MCGSHASPAFGTYKSSRHWQIATTKHAPPFLMFAVVRERDPHKSFGDGNVLDITHVEVATKDAKPSDLQTLLHAQMLFNILSRFQMNSAAPQLIQNHVDATIGKAFAHAHTHNTHTHAHTRTLSDTL